MMLLKLYAPTEVMKLAVMEVTELKTAILQYADLAEQKLIRVQIHASHVLHLMVPRPIRVVLIEKISMVVWITSQLRVNIFNQCIIKVLRQEAVLRLFSFVGTVFCNIENNQYSD